MLGLKILWEAFYESFRSKPPKIAAMLIGLMTVTTLMNGCGSPEILKEGVPRAHAIGTFASPSK